MFYAGVLYLHGAFYGELFVFYRNDSLIISFLSNVKVGGVPKKGKFRRFYANLSRFQVICAVACIIAARKPYPSIFYVFFEIFLFAFERLFYFLCFAKREVSLSCINARFLAFSSNSIKNGK